MSYVYIVLLNDSDAELARKKVKVSPTGEVNLAEFIKETTIYEGDMIYISKIRSEEE